MRLLASLGSAAEPACLLGLLSLWWLALVVVARAHVQLSEGELDWSRVSPVLPASAPMAWPAAREATSRALSG